MYKILNEPEITKKESKNRVVTNDGGSRSTCEKWKETKVVISVLRGRIWGKWPRDNVLTR